MFKFNQLFSIFLLVGLSCLFLQTATAVPPVPGTYDPETMVFYESGIQVPIEICDPGPLRAPGSYRGVWKFPILFIQAADVSHIYSVATWSEQLFTVGTYDPGSMRDYYREVSYDQFDIDGITLGWFTAAHNYAYYVGDNFGLDGGAAEMAREAVLLAEAQHHPNWSEYDNDGDGKVDGVIIIHQGHGGESGDPGTIWSHVSNFEEVTLDGVTLSKYSIQPETKSTGVMETIGTICHEHGHILGLPDLYDINYTTKPAPISNWCIMASGSGGGSPMGAKPNHFCGWSKYKLGWVNTVTIDTEGTYTLNNIQNNSENSVYQIPINSDEKEYFIISNRWMDHTKTFDHMPARWLGGMMIYHSDDNVGGSNNGNRELWHIVLEDSTFDSGAGDDEGDDVADCAFAADEGHTTFGRFGHPNSSGNFIPSNIIISEISNRGSSMSFNVNFMPTILLDSYEITPLGNQTYEIVASLTNLASVNANNVQAVLSTEASNIVIDSNTANYGTISKGGGVADNKANPFIYHSTGTDGSLEQFTIVATANGGYTSTDMTFTLPINPNRILLIDDDATVHGNPQDIEQFYTDALFILDYDYEHWQVYQLGYPSAGVMSLYDLVIWSDGKSSRNAPAGAGLDALTDFLDMGGDLFWSSHEFIYSQYPYSDENLVEYIEFEEGSFCREYLHLLAAEQDEYFYEAYGVPGGIFDGLTFEFVDEFSNDLTKHDLWWPDEFVTDGTALPVLTAGPHDCSQITDPDYHTFCTEDAAEGENTLEAASCALLYQGEYRLFFMSVPAQCIPTDDPAPENRQQLMKRVFEWFGITNGANATPGTDIDLNSPMYEAGDNFKLSLNINNPGPTVTADVYVLLDVFGELFYFWPTWTEDLNFETRELPTGYDSYEILFDFDWPADSGTGSDIRFWAALLDHTTSELLGNYDFTPVYWQ